MDRPAGTKNQRAISEDASIDPFRAVTGAEIEHYQAFGWVKLDKFIPKDKVRAILTIARERMGEDGSANAKPGAFSYFNALALHDPDHADTGPVIRHFGAAAVALGRRRGPAGVRYFIDYFGVKLPARRSDGHGKSDWHQDFAAQVADRSGGMTFWAALVDMPPEMGTMEFLNGSHRHGVMGDYRTYGDGNLLDSYPELIDQCPSSRPLTYAAGDVTVHSDLCVHAAGPNLSGQPRWTYIVAINPADARWTGAPSVSFDTAGLTHLEPLDDRRFPLLA